MIKGMVMIFIGLWFGAYQLPPLIESIRLGNMRGIGISAIFLMCFTTLPVFFGGFFIRRHILKKRETRELISRVDHGPAGQTDKG